MSYSIDAYYGINKNGNKYGCIPNNNFDRIISTEEFYKKIEHIDNSKSEQSFKVGDWVYSEYAEEDYRKDYGNRNKFIPIFQIEEIFQGEWARPVKNQSSGILIKYLRLATPEEIASVTKPKINESMFEKDKWYKYNNKPGCVICYQENATGYGFWNYKWSNYYTISDIKNYSKATNEEVIEILLKYAKEQYPVGTIIKSAHHKTTPNTTMKVDSIGEFTKSDEGKNIIWNIEGKGRYGFLYEDGKWAEIVSKPITMGKGILEQIDKQVDKQPKRWKVGDKVTYKSRKECGGKYKFGGGDQEGFIGKIKEYRIYNSSEKCWEINVTTKSSTYIMLESEFKEWDNPKNDELSFLENLGTESKEIPPCKEGDYLYLIDAIIDKKSSEYKEYKKYTGTILKVTNISSDNYAKNCWWIKYTPTLFGGGGCRINGNGWQWNKHIRLATSYEISINKAEWSIPDSSVISQITKEEKVEVQLISVPKI